MTQIEVTAANAMNDFRNKHRDSCAGDPALDHDCDYDYSLTDDNQNAYKDDNDQTTSTGTTLEFGSSPTTTTAEVALPLVNDCSHGYDDSYKHGHAPDNHHAP